MHLWSAGWRLRRWSCALRRGARLACATRLRPGRCVMADIYDLLWRSEEAARLLQVARACVAISKLCGRGLLGVWRVALWRLGGWLLLWLKTLANSACFAFADSSRASRRMPCAGCLLARAHCYSGDLPLLRVRGLWRSLAPPCLLLRPALAFGARSLAEFCAGPSPCHLFAGLKLCGWPALTTRRRHAQQLVRPTWGRRRVGDRLLLRWAHDLRTLALTLRWAETLPLLRRAQSLRLPLLCVGKRTWRAARRPDSRGV